MSKKDKRIDRIIEHLRVVHAASVKSLAELENVTEMTIRRDLAILSKESVILFMQGVAIYKDEETEQEQQTISANSSRDKTENKVALEYISTEAVNMINDGDIVFLDSGLTTELMAQKLNPDFNLTIVTNNLNIMTIVSQYANYSLIAPGGIYNKSRMAFESQYHSEMFENICISLGFFSPFGISEKLSVTSTNINETVLKQSALEASERKILISDYSKFGKISLAHFADLDAFDLVISNKGLNQNFTEKISNLGISLKLC